MDWNFLIKNKRSISVSTDTRNLPVGCVFVALKGERFNANLFALQALEMGAEYAIVDEDIPQTCSMQRHYDKRLIRVDNSLLALQDLARAWRRQWSEQRGTNIGGGLLSSKPVIAITGTNGKTTTKELTAAVLSQRYNVLYTKGNLNNQVGVPLTLLQLTAEHDIAIIEMGASHPGDIRELVEVAEPDMGLITNVGKAHLLGFGSFEGVQQTKAELYDYLSDKAKTQETVVFRNLDNAYLQQMAEDHISNPHVTTIGYHRVPMLSGTNIVGEYNAENIEAAVTIGEYFGITRAEAEHAVRQYEPHNNRSEERRTEKNLLRIDAYNANPTSMQAAILSFLAPSVGDGRQDTLPSSKKLFILGDMLELGDYSHTEHQNIVNMLVEQKVDEVLLVGHEFMLTNPPYPVFSTTDELAAYLQQHPVENRHVLLKGSRGIQLEKIIEQL